MVDFVQKTYASNTVALFDIKISQSGAFIIPAPLSSGSWTARKKDGSGNYVLAANTGFGAATAGGAAIDDSELYAYATHLSSIYRGKRSSGASDDFAYAPDNWNLAMGASCRALDVNPANTFIAAGVGNNVAVWNVTTKASVVNFATGSTVEHVRFSPSGNYLIAVSATTGVFLWRISSGTFTRITTGSLPAAGYGSLSAAWNHDETMFVTGSATGSNLGPWVFLLTDAATHTFTRQAGTIFDVAPPAGATSAVTFLNNDDGKDYLLVASRTTSATPKLYKWNGTQFVEQTTTGLPTGTFDYFRAAKNGRSVAYINVATTYAGVFDFDPISNLLPTNTEAVGLLASSAATVYQTIEAAGDATGLLPQSDAEVFMPIAVTASGIGFLPQSSALTVLMPADDTGAPDLIQVRPAVIATEGVGVTLTDTASGEFVYSMAIGLLPQSEALALFPVTAEIPAVGLLPRSDALVYQMVEANGVAVGLLGLSDALVEIAALEVTGEATGLLAQPAGELKLAYSVEIAAIGLLPTSDALAGVPVSGDVAAVGILPVSEAEAGQANEVVVEALGLLPQSSAEATQPILATVDSLGLIGTSEALVDVFNVEATGEATGLLARSDAFVAVPYRVEVEAVGLRPVSEAEVKIVSGVTVAAVGLLGLSSSLLARSYRIDSNNRGFLPRSLAVVGTPVRINGAAVGLRPVSAGLLKLRYEARVEAVGLLPSSAGTLRVFNRADAEATGLLPGSAAEIMLRNVVDIAAVGLLPTVDVDAKTRYLVTVAAVGLLGRSASESDAEERLYAATPVFADGGALSVGGGVFFGFGKKLTTG